MLIDESEVKDEDDSNAPQLSARVGEKHMIDQRGALTWHCANSILFIATFMVVVEVTVKEIVLFVILVCLLWILQCYMLVLWSPGLTDTLFVACCVVFQKDSWLSYILCKWDHNNNLTVHQCNQHRQHRYHPQFRLLRSQVLVKRCPRNR